MLWNVTGRKRHGGAAGRTRSNVRGYRQRAWSAEDRERDRGRKRGRRLTRPVILRRGATAVGFGLADGLRRIRIGRVRFVHRTCLALGAAGHTGLRRRHPARAHGHVAGRERQRQEERRQTPADDQHSTRMLESRRSVKSRRFHAAAGLMASPTNTEAQSRHPSGVHVRKHRRSSVSTGICQGPR